MDRDSAPGVLEVLTGNRKTLFGVASLLLAVVLAFSAVYRRSATFSREGGVESGETIGIEKRRPEDEGNLSILPREVPLEEPVEIVFLNDNLEVVRKTQLERGEDLGIEEGESYFRLASGGLDLNYEYRIDYSYQPLRLLAIPAALFTVFGVIAIYRGFEQFMSDFATERVQELEDREQGKNEGDHVDFMGVDNGEGGSE
ncbi:hypothetical protein KGY71_00045 [Candidatus Bipolaricaulota bacterium]|nr:hypothetical protein [Candidatus Bipolaricaulota bacterium]